MHDLIVVGIPLFAILSGILFSHARLEKLESRLDSRMDKMENQANARFDRIESRLDRMQADLGQFYNITGKHEVRIETLEKRN